MCCTKPRARSAIEDSEPPPMPANSSDCTSHHMPSSLGAIGENWNFWRKLFGTGTCQTLSDGERGTPVGESRRSGTRIQVGTSLWPECRCLREFGRGLHAEA